MSIKNLTPDYDIKKDAISLVDYNPAWPTLASAMIQRIKTILPYSWIVDIQHVGSTAIPGIAAKPIIDIYVGVTSLALAIQHAIAPIEAMGFQYWQENLDKTRMFFVKGMPSFGTGRTHHIHITEYESTPWRRTILFRDYLRQHPAEAKCYEQLKHKLMEQHRYDREAYTDGKNDYVNAILQKAGFKAAELD
jgi:GrpB-like predicted nucleotidyltransferase (UPF0157 family)